MIRASANAIIIFWTLYKLSKFFQGKVLEALLMRKARAKLAQRNAVKLPQDLANVSKDTT
jgi:hypothetical protein